MARSIIKIILLTLLIFANVSGTFARNDIFPHSGFLVDSPTEKIEISFASGTNLSTVIPRSYSELVLAQRSKFRTLAFNQPLLLLNKDEEIAWLSQQEALRAGDLQFRISPEEFADDQIYQQFILRIQQFIFENYLTGKLQQQGYELYSQHIKQTSNFVIHKNIADELQHFIEKLVQAAGELQSLNVDRVAIANIPRYQSTKFNRRRWLDVLAESDNEFEGYSFEHYFVIDIIFWYFDAETGNPLSFIARSGQILVTHNQSRDNWHLDMLHVAPGQVISIADIRDVEQLQVNAQVLTQALTK